jgi:proline iminopeptidase
MLHGGPGGGIQRGSIHLYTRYFRVITFDQRGCGKSTPFGSLENNTTWDIVEDIERLRKHLEVEDWIVTGGSWGTTLALLYAEKYPRFVKGLILRSVCLIDAASNEWFYEKGGASEVYPEA